DGLAALALLGLKHADQPGGDDAAGEGGLVRKEEDIYRVAVLAPGRGEEAKVVGKAHALRQELAQPPHAAVLVKLVLVAGAAGGVDHHVQAPRVGVDRGQFVDRSRHPYTPPYA